MVQSLHTMLLAPSDVCHIIIDVEESLCTCFCHSNDGLTWISFFFILILVRIR